MNLQSVLKKDLRFFEFHLNMMQRPDAGMVTATFSPHYICEYLLLQKKKKHLWIPLQEIKPMFANKFQSFQHLAPCRSICSHFKCFIWLHFLFLKFFMQLQVAYLIYCWIFFDRLQWSTRISKRICSACLMKRQILSMFFYLHIINLGRLGFLGSRV